VSYVPSESTGIDEEEEEEEEESVIGRYIM
jgi:hypothetical protein